VNARGPFAGWPADAVALVDRAAERHGGWSRFAQLSSLTLEFLALGGLLPRLKGNGRSWQPPARVTVWPHECRVRFGDFAGGDGWFERGDVRLEVGGAVTAESRDHRATFAGAARRRRWSPLDAAYFFGYALANYLAQPFLLSHARFLDGDARSVRVEFAADWPAHCRVQRFWFADDGLLVRHDYVAEIIGGWARGAHFVGDYVEVDGLWIPRTRVVRARVGRWVLPVVVLRARFGAIEVSPANRR
jgi:hypothetical protein